MKTLENLLCEDHEIKRETVAKVWTSICASRVRLETPFPLSYLVWHLPWQQQQLPVFRRPQNLGH